MHSTYYSYNNIMGRTKWYKIEQWIWRMQNSTAKIHTKTLTQSLNSTVIQFVSVSLNRVHLPKQQSLKLFHCSAFASWISGSDKTSYGWHGHGLKGKFAVKFSPPSYEDTPRSSHRWCWWLLIIGLWLWTSSTGLIGYSSYVTVRLKRGRGLVEARYRKAQFKAQMVGELMLFLTAFSFLS